MHRYESSDEDITTISPRAGRKPSDENVSPTESPPSGVNTASPTLSSSITSSHSREREKENKDNNKGSKGRSGSQPPAPTAVFGVPIEELFAREGGNVPYILMRMIQFLEEKGISSSYTLFLLPLLSP